jgi:hypothetical protein
MAITNEEIQKLKIGDSLEFSFPDSMAKDIEGILPHTGTIAGKVMEIVQRQELGNGTMMVEVGLEVGMPEWFWYVFFGGDEDVRLLPS